MSHGSAASVPNAYSKPMSAVPTSNAITGYWANSVLLICQPTGYSAFVETERTSNRFLWRVIAALSVFAVSVSFSYVFAHVK